MAGLDMQTMDKKDLFSGVPCLFLSKEDEAQPDFRKILNKIPSKFKNLPIIKIHSYALEKFDIENFQFSKLEDVTIVEKELKKMKGKKVGKINSYSYEGEKFDFESYRQKFDDGTERTLKDFFEKTMMKGNTFLHFTASIKMEDLDLGSLAWDLSKHEGLEDEFNGINTTWVYVGLPDSGFEVHLEDGNQRSINLHVYGKPKVWFAIDNEDIHKFEEFMRKTNKAESRMCPVFHRHKQSFVDMAALAKEGISVYKVVQNPGDIIITNSFHQGINLGYNMNLAINIFTGIKEEINFINRGGHCPVECKYDAKSLIFNELKKDLIPEVRCQEEGCEKAYTTSKGLRGHLKNVHKLKPPKSENENWKCLLCDKKAKQPESHMKSHHRDVSSVHCTLCRTIFESRMALRDHWIKSHKTDRNCKVKNCKAEAVRFDDIFNFHNCPQQEKRI